METLDKRQKKIRELSLQLALKRYELYNEVTGQHTEEDISKLCKRICELELSVKAWRDGREKELSTWLDYF